ncbi:uncharacterized protein UV8b_04085 [Ustilaginoidea virens]|uniref:Cryptochrome DASH n=1 Tax=Ustilaginoidea virens TaxID=1159556 RepID=A0A063C5X2_USTVR|nr:uncharacterized protein UV8b_04085 [Ustilaginoidea virens]QUC19844.1 hypothetical protein UV8b_04085 [Ustilaginoidea virens]GAO14846.1 hypothetical protein UVI_02005730 [Ustilaginoidea virens]
MPGSKLLVYLLRRDLRVADNPILHHLATGSDHGFTHMLPIYVFPAHQIEISGFLKDGETSPYPPARSQVGKFWRCGPHRAKFISEAVWNLKDSLEELGSGLVIRVGKSREVLDNLVKELKSTATAVNSIWMTEELSWEEVEEQKELASLCCERDIDFKIWKDEKYFVDDRDTGLAGPEDLPDVFTTYRKSQEPLRGKPRRVLPRPGKSSLPTFPSESSIPPQLHPFTTVSSLDHLRAMLLKPLDISLQHPPSLPERGEAGHSLQGGETAAWERLVHLAKSGALTSYKETRNGLVGNDYSTKLSGYLALGCLTARQVHEELVKLEDGIKPEFQEAAGYGEGENEGTKGIRFELLWRDYMRLCTAKFGRNLFRLSGFRQGKSYEKKWASPSDTAASPDQEPCPRQVARLLERFKDGTTGMGIIDASQRELFLTGHTSNRARQNVASFLSKHLGIDWRYGAEWYEMLLTDYDVSSNWANWQYVAGVGNDPRGDARTFNPVKQSFSYDKEGTYVRMWVKELRRVEKLENVFQVWTTDEADLEKYGLSHNIMATDPVKKIEFNVDHKPRAARRPFNRRRGQHREGDWGVAANGSPGQARQGNRSGTSSDGAASENGGAAACDTRATGPARPQHTNGSARRANYTTSQDARADGNGHNGRGWHQSQSGQSRGHGPTRGYSRSYGARGSCSVGRQQGGSGSGSGSSYAAVPRVALGPFAGGVAGTH